MPAVLSIMTTEDVSRYCHSLGGKESLVGNHYYKERTFHIGIFPLHEQVVKKPGQYGHWKMIFRKPTSFMFLFHHSWPVTFAYIVVAHQGSALHLIFYPTELALTKAGNVSLL
jgi:hypothetical protein